MRPYHRALRWGLLPLLLGLGTPAFAPADDDGLEAALDGFDEAPDDPLDDALDGFDDTPDATPPDTSRPAPERFWDLTGSLSLGASVNYLDHDSATGSDYDGLSRLRTRLNLELDLDLPGGWKGRISGFGFYDWSYRIEGRNNYTDDVLDEYEWEADLQEVWVQGSVIDEVDLKIGRQIVNWGRSDTLRVLDILNPLDNREPGLVDIEDLRRPVMMVKGDVYHGDWSLSLIAIPEIRFSKNPPIGSDFSPTTASFGQLEIDVAPEHIPSESFDNTSWAAALMGIFPGWDVSFHFARVWMDPPYLRGSFFPLALLGPNPTSAFAGTELRHSRITLVGAGGNYTFGSWLLKSEIAWTDGVDYGVSPRLVLPGIGAVEIPNGTLRRSRLDVMGGVEYYGLTDTNIVLEVALRHIFGFREAMRPNFGTEENRLETALRITRNFWNERLDARLVAIASETTPRTAV